MSKFREEENRSERPEPQGDRPSRRAERAAAGGEETGGRSFRREAKVGLSVLGVLLTSLGGVAGLRMTGKMPQMFAKKDAAASAADDQAKDKPKLASGPKYAKSSAGQAGGASIATANDAGAATDISTAAGLMDNQAGVPAGGAAGGDPFAADGYAAAAPPADGEDPAAAAVGNAWQQGQTLANNAAGAVDQAVDAAVDTASGMVDQARQALDQSAQQYIDQQAPAGADQFAGQAQQAYDQAADALQQRAEQAVDQARDLVQQGSRWVQEQASGALPQATAGAAAGNDWRGGQDPQAGGDYAQPTQPIGDGQAWPEQPPAGGGNDELAVDAASEPPLRIPADPPASRQAYDRRGPEATALEDNFAQDRGAERYEDTARGDNRRDEYGRGADDRYAAPPRDRDAAGHLADQQDPWANDPPPADDGRGVAPRYVDEAGVAPRDHQGYDSARDLFPEDGAAPRTAAAAPGGGAATYTVQPDDNYWRISQKLYGTGAYFKALYEHNRAQFPRADRMQAGDVIATPEAQALAERYPDLVPASARHQRPADEAQQASRTARADGRRVYVVRQGDTLFDIARQELGRAVRWAEIYELNRDLLGDDIENLRPGTELVLPAEQGRMTSRGAYRSRR